jgi:hypothetical protein
VTSRRETAENVSRAAAARVIERLIAERADEDGRGGAASLAAEIALAMNRGRPGIERLIYQVRTGKVRRQDGSSYIQRTVSFDRVDLLLTGCSREDLWYSPELIRWGAARQGTTQPRRYKRRPDAKMSDADVLAAHRRYLDGKTLRDLGRELWQKHGYSSPNCCANAIGDFFIRDCLPTRDRVEAIRAASTVHGNASRADRKRNTLRYRVHRKRVRRASGEVRGVRCAATTALGRPCRNAALATGDYCVAHEPTRRGEVIANINRWRRSHGLREVAA